jgi:hypothetical protein
MPADAPIPTTGKRSETFFAAIAGSVVSLLFEEGFLAGM